MSNRNDDRGPHYGKGPKGYRRTDERIRELVCEAITEHGRVDARDVEVTVKDGIVTLSGLVQHRHEKRELEMLSERVDGVDEVHNEVRLRREPTPVREPIPRREDATPQNGIGGRQTH